MKIEIPVDSWINPKKENYLEFWSGNKLFRVDIEDGLRIQEIGGIIK